MESKRYPILESWSWRKSINSIKERIKSGWVTGNEAQERQKIHNPKYWYLGRGTGQDHIYDPMINFSKAFVDLKGEYLKWFFQNNDTKSKIAEKEIEFKELIKGNESSSDDGGDEGPPKQVARTKNPRRRQAEERKEQKSVKDNKAFILHSKLNSLSHENLKKIYKQEIFGEIPQEDFINFASEPFPQDVFGGGYKEKNYIIRRKKQKTKKVRPVRRRKFSIKINTKPLPKKRTRKTEPKKRKHRTRRR